MGLIPGYGSCLIYVIQKRQEICNFLAYKSWLKKIIDVCRGVEIIEIYMNLNLSAKENHPYLSFYSGSLMSLLHLTSEIQFELNSKVGLYTSILILIAIRTTERKLWLCRNRGLQL